MTVDYDDVIVDPEFGILCAVELDGLGRELEASQYSSGADVIIEAVKTTRLMVAVRIKFLRRCIDGSLGATAIDCSLRNNVASVLTLL